MRRLMRFESVTDPRASEIDMSPCGRSAPAPLTTMEKRRYGIRTRLGKRFGSGRSRQRARKVILAPSGARQVRLLTFSTITTPSPEQCA
jgi:hypothetical protein